MDIDALSFDCCPRGHRQYIPLVFPACMRLVAPFLYLASALPFDRTMHPRLSPRSLPPLPYKGPGGFTVLEMMIVLAITGILAAAAIPSFEQFREIYRLRGATREVFVELQRARMAAIKENNRYNFSLDDRTHYSIHDDEDNDGNEDGDETVTIRDIDTAGRRVQLAADSEVVFLPNGTVTFPGAAVATAFSVTNGSGQCREINVTRGGRIRVVSSCS